MENNYFDQSKWMRKRFGHFTASEIFKLFVSGKKKGELFGQGAQSYIRRKAAELLTMEYKEEMDFKQCQWGEAHEHEAVLEFEKVIGRTGTYYGVANPKFFDYGEHAGGSPDWEIEGQEGADIKCPFNTDEHILNFRIQSADEFKDLRWEYYCQGQMNMFIRKWKKFHFVSYDPRMIERKYRLKIVTVYPDTEWVDEFKYRLDEAIKELQSLLELMDACPSVVIAHYEPELQTTII